MFFLSQPHIALKLSQEDNYSLVISIDRLPKTAGIRDPEQIKKLMPASRNVAQRKINSNEVWLSNCLRRL